MNRKIFLQLIFILILLAPKICSSSSSLISYLKDKINPGVYVECLIKINPNSTGDVIVIVAHNKLYEGFTSDIRNELGNYFLESGFEVQNYEESDRIGLKMTKANIPVKEVNEYCRELGLEKDPIIFWRGLIRTKLLVDFTVPKTIQDVTDNIYLNFVLSQTFTFILSVEFPSPPKKHNANETKNDGRMLSWEIALNSDFNTIKAQCIITHYRRIIISLAVILTAVGTSIIIKKRKGTKSF